ncbi:MAG TPA: galactosyldiacylglycerol synthase, partial [Anaerolineae bacterium]|nr:galactosyldiacylglycerol synthase [Anaerolineae bacterium]
MTTPPRLLILYITAGDGHRRAAEAVANQLQSRGAHVSLLDAMPHAHPIFRAIYVGGGLGLIIRLPSVFHAAYRLTDRSKVDRVIRGPRHRAQQLSTQSLLQAITAYQPDAIICTHFLPAEVCAGWQRSRQIKVPVYTVITDFEPHRIWQHQGIAGYCVATDAAASRLMADGIDRSIIKVTGIPIQTDFAHLPDRATAIKKLQLNPDRSTLLIMGGGLGVGKIEHIAQALIKKPIDAQIIFITGHNRALRRRLQQQSPDWIVRGFVN